MGPATFPEGRRRGLSGAKGPEIRIRFPRGRNSWEELPSAGDVVTTRCPKECLVKDQLPGCGNPEVGESVREGFPAEGHLAERWGARVFLQVKGWAAGWNGTEWAQALKSWVSRRMLPEALLGARTLVAHLQGGTKPESHTGTQSPGGRGEGAGKQREEREQAESQATGCFWWLEDYVLSGACAFQMPGAPPDSNNDKITVTNT
jgi:hypothetical protein